MIRRHCASIPDFATQAVLDLLRRNFSASAPDRAWIGDITYLPLVGGKLRYLATVIDVYSRRLLGWSMAGHMRTELVTNALDMAVRVRGGLVDGVIFHGDHGAPYGAKAFADTSRRAGIRRSMGAVGTSADNAAAESFFASGPNPQRQTGGPARAGEPRPPVSEAHRDRATMAPHLHLTTVGARERPGPVPSRDQCSGGTSEWLDVNCAVVTGR